MKTSKTELYEPPKIEVLEVEVEAGFALSNGNGTINGWEPDKGYWEV